ncbi:MAG: hypothetical protein COA83_10650 [Methylophaga sp.]|nr:MAG: hypothetical protein COA83_10650 [Methylophaga sp.]
MVVWKGWGLAIIGFVFIFVLPIELLVEHYFGIGQYKLLPWPIPLAIFLGAIPTTLVGVMLNKKPARVLIDPETGEKVELKSTHSLFWIPMQYWGIILVSLSLWMYLNNIGFRF